ncbi:MAG: SUMF1/EgtB/PvdO family nonheme iron enzyme [Saprospiraceae bacterium]
MPEPSKGIGAAEAGMEMTGGVNYLLAIAIDAYKHLPFLYNCKKDAETFIGLLVKNYQFEEANVVRVFDEAATLKGIHAAFRDLVGKVTPKDNLVVYFSGHGEYDSLINEGYWIPIEAHQGSLDEYFSNDTVRRYLSSINSHHTFLIADSCFSGALFEEGTGKSGGSRSERDPSRWGLTAGRKEIVSDGKPGMHSPFADALLDRLRKNQGSLGVQKLCAEVLEQVEANAFQTPIGEPLRVQGHRNGQFYFHPKRDEGSAWQAALATSSVQALLDFMAEFPNSEPVKSGEIYQHIAGLEEEQLWREATRSKMVSGYFDYLNQTRLGKYRTEANEAIAGFRRKDEEARRREQEKRETEIREAQRRKDEEARRRMEAEESKRKAAEEKARKEAERQRKKEEKRPVVPFDWNRLKLPLAVVAATIVIAIVIWQVAKPSKQPAAWDCAQHYDQCQDQGGYYMVRKGPLWGFADEKGNEFIKPRFQVVTPFDSSGLALVKENAKYGWIDREGRTKIAFEYDEAKMFAGGKAEVKKGAEVFFIDAFGGRLAEEKEAIVQAEPEKPKEEPKKSTPPPAAKPASFSPPEMVTVKGGTFTMGCTDEQGSDCYDWEKPAHQVTVGDFQIGKYEVTQAQWKAIMGSNPSSFKNCDQCPVENVSWNDIQEFIKKLNQRTGGNYRLPTEAEWEYAARGGQKSNKTKFAGSQNLGAVGWYGDNSGNKTHPVGGKSPNELGIYDMSGNVWEWCADWYGDYSSDAQTNPAGPVKGSYRVGRGGSWVGYPLLCRVSGRYSLAPALRNDGIGFRLARSPQ